MVILASHFSLVVTWEIQNLNAFLAYDLKLKLRNSRVHDNKTGLLKLQSFTWLKEIYDFLLGKCNFNPIMCKHSLQSIPRSCSHFSQCEHHQMLENTLVWHYKHHTFTCIVVNLPKSTWFQNVSRDYYLGLNMCPTGQGINITWEGAHTLVGR